jgi:sugar phosphate isomerase/epimerase
MNDIGAPSQLLRGRAADVAQVFRHCGLTCVQLTPQFVGLRCREPAEITSGRCLLTAEPFHAAGLRVVCIAGTTNLLDPNLDRRHAGIVRLHALIRHCRDFGADKLVIETGSLSPRSPWAPYPPNRSREAWTELRLILAEALRRAGDHGVILLVKLECSHVLATVEDAVRLKQELDHPCLRFIMDPVHWLGECEPGELDGRLESVFEELGPWAPVVHLKDLRFAPTGVSMPRAGKGVLDYALLGRLLRRYQPEAPIILEHLRPDEVAAARAHVEQALRNCAEISA